MKNLLIACFVILAFSYNLLAMWASIPTEELVKETDLIIIGTLQSVSEHTKDNIDYSQGTIVIEKVIAGYDKTTEGIRLKSGDKILLKWQNSSMIACPRVEHKGDEDKKGIWLLEVENDGTVSSHYPWRFSSLNELGKIKKILRKVNLRKSSRRVKLLEETSQNIANQQIQISDTIQNQTIEPVKTVETVSEYSTFNALLVALFSIGFYWLLYRSRFKIR